jgi:hypothetical protein
MVLTHLNEQKFPVNIRPETNACWDIGDVLVVSASDVLCIFPCISTQLSNLHLTKVRTLPRISGFTIIPWQAVSASCCITSKSVIGAEYTKLLCVPISRAAEDLDQESSMPIDWVSVSYPLLTESLVHVSSDSAEKMNLCPIIHETYALTLMMRHMFQDYWKSIRQNTMVHCIC